MTLKYNNNRLPESSTDLKSSKFAKFYLIKMICVHCVPTINGWYYFMSLKMVVALQSQLKLQHG